MKMPFLLMGVTCAMIVSLVGVGAAATNTYFIINDHLGTPQAMTDETGKVVWKANYDPYGAATVDEDPDGDGKKVVCNLRFPGQYYDAETGWHYNWHRYYDPALGRYLQADPVGAKESTYYSYVMNEPISSADLTGLAVYKGEVQFYGVSSPYKKVLLGKSMLTGTFRTCCRNGRYQEGLYSGAFVGFEFSPFLISTAS